MPDTTLPALERLCTNLRWSWHHPTRALLDSMPGAEVGRHPLEDLRSADADALDAWLADSATVIDDLAAELTEVEGRVEQFEIAYFSPEFGIAAEVPQYSGGLGILAGDHLKSASDLALPLVGVGLLYGHGFFRQDIEGEKQKERYPATSPTSIGATDTGQVVVVPVAGVEVATRVWTQSVGSTLLVLLDTDVDSNPTWARSITDRLYSGDRIHRIRQELVLGVGGVRALRALGIAPGVFHLNEGHACFLLLELLREQLAEGFSLETAVESVRGRTLFTTHTPVPAGIDRFTEKVVRAEVGPWLQEIGLDLPTVMAWARMPADPPAVPFNTAALAFELCGRANGVSQLHAGVSQELFASIPRAATVEGITNGVHARTWVAPEIAGFYDEHLGSTWADGDPDAWAGVTDVDPTALIEARRRGRRSLVDLVAATTGVKLDADRPVIGFARRFATYKRAALLLRDRDGLARSLDAGAQFVFAGKAHPADDDGKAVLHEIAAFAASDQARGQFALVPDYDIGIAQALYAGSDVWLNNPIRPHEACGTSGEKAALNGGLNCSILDGWWADWFADGIGWAIPTSSHTDPDARDLEEAEALHRLVADDVMPTVLDPDRWWAMTARMLVHLGPLVTAGRMVAEYERRFYGPIRGR